MNLKSIAQGQTSRPVAYAINQSAICIAVAAFLLTGCGDRRDKETTPAAASPSPKATAPSKIRQRPQVELAQMFTAAGAALSSLKTPEELAQIKPWRNVTLNPQPTGLKVTATNGDPAVLLPAFRGQSAILELIIHSPADTTLQLFYKLPGQKSYGPQSLTQKIKSGRNVVYAELPNLTASVGPLRLDPGMVPGEYLIESFQAKIFSAAGNP